MTYTIDMQGYWLDRNRHVMPPITGIYCVYACTYHPDTNTVSIHELLYIGKAIDVNIRLSSHEGRMEWAGLLRPGETLCYACAAVDGRSLDVVEAVMVYALQPPCNDRLKDSYNHLPSTVLVSGKYPFPRMACLSAP